MDPFSTGFVEILAAEQTPESQAWFQGTADAVRKARRHFAAEPANHYLILAGDHLYRMDYRPAARRAPRAPRGHHDRGACPRRRRTRPPWASSRSTPGPHRRVRGKAGRRPAGEMATSLPPARRCCAPTTTGRSSPRWASTSSRARCCSTCSSQPGDRLRPRADSARAAALSRVRIPVCRLLGRRGHGGQLLRGQRPADAAGRAVQLLRSVSPSTRTRDSCRRRG